MTDNPENKTAAWADTRYLRCALRACKTIVDLDALENNTAVQHMRDRLAQAKATWQSN